jgi:lysophospholipid acyltransferase (LPLAT)-like uncharacterized protein
VKRWKVRLITLTAYLIAKIIYATMRFQIVNEEAIEKERMESGTGVLLCGWHGRSFIPIIRFTGRRYWAMISTSRDGELQNELFTKLRFQTVRGSTSARGAVRGALTLSKELRRGGILVLTPDGPRGPHHHVHGGVIFLAEKSGCKVIPCGVSAWPRFEFKTWDSYMLPLPFSKGAMVYGDPIAIPPMLTEQERESWCNELAETLKFLEQKAEELVGYKPKVEAERTGAPV